ncbi:MAG: undecaprenyl-diphosphate phosphatase [Planctomycetota bacterium]|nr:undecaprenyl-diphosphate phosphatase [Planctomycetota bacterium]
MTEPVLGYGAALVYGLIQGVAEFLPVSSSGHLAIAHLVGLGSLPEELELPFDVLLHAATLIAILVAFAPDIWRALRCGPRVWMILSIAVVPAGLVGLFGGDLVAAAGDSWWVMGLCYLFTATLLVTAERLSAARSDQTADLAQLTPRQALIVGLLQIPALLPGVSRSGSTIAGGLFGGLGPSLAVSVSFLVGLPLIAGAAAKDALDGGFAALLASVGFGPLTLAFVAALVSGLGAIVLLKLVVGQRRLVWFAGYCVLVAIACFVCEVAIDHSEPAASVAPTEIED